MALQKGCDLLLIFCRVDGAGGVDQPPARLEQRRSGIQNCRLCGKQFCLPVSFQLFIAEIRFFCQNAQAAARHIRQDAVCHGQCRVRFGGIITKGMHPGKAHTVYRGADQPHTVFGCIATVQCSCALHLLGQQNRLAAGGSAQVQHRFTGGCAHAKGCQLTGLSFYMVVSLPEQLVVRRAAREPCQHTAGHDALPHLCCALLCKQRTQLCSAGLEGVCTQTGQTAIGLIGQDAQCFIRVVFVEEFCHIPPGRA